MNFLTFSNRFAKAEASDTNIAEITGYMHCLQDLLAYCQSTTNFDPGKRMIDAVDILDSITETNASLHSIHSRLGRELLSQVNKMSKAELSGKKVGDFLSANVSAADPDDLKDVFS